MVGLEELKKQRDDLDAQIQALEQAKSERVFLAEEVDEAWGKYVE